MHTICSGRTPKVSAAALQSALHSGSGYNISRSSAFAPAATALGEGGNGDSLVLSFIYSAPLGCSPGTYGARPLNFLLKNLLIYSSLLPFAICHLPFNLPFAPCHLQF